MALFENIVNVALTTTTWQPVSSERLCNALTAHTRNGEDWKVSTVSTGSAYFTVAGADHLQYEFATPEEGIMFYVQGVAADILEVLFE